MPTAQQCPCRLASSAQRSRRWGVAARGGENLPGRLRKSLAVRSRSGPSGNRRAKGIQHRDHIDDFLSDDACQRWQEAERRFPDEKWLAGQVGLIHRGRADLHDPVSWTDFVREYHQQVSDTNLIQTDVDEIVTGSAMGGGRVAASQRVEHKLGATGRVRFECLASRQHQHDDRRNQVFAEQHRRDDGHAGQDIGSELSAGVPAEGARREAAPHRTSGRQTEAGPRRPDVRQMHTATPDVTESLPTQS
jgi:hypothetical protein